MSAFVWRNAVAGNKWQFSALFVCRAVVAVVVVVVAVVVVAAAVRSPQRQLVAGIATRTVSVHHSQRTPNLPEIYSTPARRARYYIMRLAL
jgi:hypothetical protein